MNAVFTIVVVIQVVAALSIIALVLLQHGKGADMGAAFGSGSSGSLFGASGSSNFLSKSTGVAAAIFFGATLFLAFVGGRSVGGDVGIMEGVVSTSPASQIPGQNVQENAPANSNDGVSSAAGEASPAQIPK